MGALATARAYADVADSRKRIPGYLNGGMDCRRLRRCFGITKASLNTQSFLSAASLPGNYQNLTEAAIKGKVDDPMA